MAKKIMFICGSPRRNGNTNTLVDFCIEGATAAGAQVERVDAARLHYKTNGCTACLGCQQSDKYECVIDDEASAVLKRIPQFDVLVLATPVYFFSFSAQIKLLMDRMFSLFKFNPQTDEMRHPLAGKTLGLIATAGGDHSGGLDLVAQTAQIMAEFSQMKLEQLLLPNAPHGAGALAHDPAPREKALVFGRTLAR